MTIRSTIISNIKPTILSTVIATVIATGSTGEGRTLSVVMGGTGTFESGMSFEAFRAGEAANGLDGDIYDFDPSGGDFTFAVTSTAEITHNNVTVDLTGCTVECALSSSRRFQVDSSKNVRFIGGTINQPGRSGIEWGTDQSGASGGPSPTGVVTGVTVTNSGNQGFQHYAQSLVVYNSCIATGSVDDGMSLHDYSTVVDNDGNYSSCAQGVQYVGHSNYTANGVICSNNSFGDLTMSGNDGVTVGEFNDCTFDGGVIAGKNGNNYNVNAVFNRCRILGKSRSSDPNNDEAPVVLGTDNGSQQFDVIFKSCEFLEDIGVVETMLFVRPDNTGTTDSTLQLINCQFMGTTGTKGGGRSLGASFQSIIITNCNFYNLAETNPIAAWNFGGMTENDTIVTNNNFDSCVGTWFGGSPAIDIGTTTDIYSYINAGAGNFRPTVSSAARGAGDPSVLPLLDLDENPFDNPPAVGAYEYEA